MSERMNKERAIEILKNLAYLYGKTYTVDECEQAIELAIASLQADDLGVSMEWLRDFIQYAEKRIRDEHEFNRDIIEIGCMDYELMRVIDILKNYKAKVEPYERKERE